MTRKSIAVAVMLMVAATTAAYGQGRMDYSAWFNGAKIDYRSGRFAKAAQKFRSALVERPGSAEAHYWLGLALTQIGSESLLSAAEQFDSCFTQDSSYVGRAVRDEENVYLTTQALARSGEAKMAAGEYRDAVRFIRRAVAVNPANPNYYMTLGNAYVALDMTDSIRIVAQDLLQREPESGQAAFFMGIYYSKVDQMDSSMKAFKVAGERYEAGTEKEKAKLVTLLKLKSMAEAGPIAKRLVELRNSAAELKRYIEADLKQPKLVQQIAEVANNLYIDQFQAGLAFNRAGLAAVQKGDATTDTLVQKYAFWLADTLFNHAVQADPENFDALWYIGYANYRLLRDTATIEGFQRAILMSEQRRDNVAAKDRELWYYLGTAEARLKQYDSAVIHLKRAVKADPTNLVAYDNLAYVYKDMAKGERQKLYTDSALHALDEKEKTGWRLSFWSTDDAAELGGIKADGGTRFIVVDLTAFNKADKPDSLDPGRLSLVGDDGKSYSLDTRVLRAGELEGRGLKVEAVAGNGRVEALAAFLVPGGVKARSLSYRIRSGAEIVAPMR